MEQNFVGTKFPVCIEKIKLFSKIS